MSRIRTLCLICVFAFLASFAVATPAWAQYLDQTGTPTFTTAEPVELGFINLANGNLHLELPLTSSPQRGSVGFSARLVYDSRIWKKVGASWQPTNVANSQGGWRFATNVDTGQVSYTVTLNQCNCQDCGDPQYETDYSDFRWTETDGTVHNFPVFTSQRSGPPPQGCGSEQPTDSEYALDSTGFKMSVTNYTDATITAKDGTQVYPSVKGTNGNYFTSSGNIVDTLNRTPVIKTVSGNQTFYDILDSQNSASRPRITVTTTTINVNTAFGQSGFTEYSGTITVIQSIALPDGTSYTFDYDSGTTAGKYGLLKTFTLPTGGQVAYTHTTFTDAYGAKNRWVSQRTAGGTWTYTPAVITSCGATCSQKVTLTKPSGDEAVYTFTMNNGAWNSDTKFYTGSAATGTLLMTLLTDFDFSQSGSNYVRTLRNTTTLPIPGGSSISKKTEYAYDTPPKANVVQINEWNFYTGAPPATPDRKTDITYLATSSYVNKNILNRPLSVTVSTGAGTWLSQTNYSYDSTTLTSLTGVTHHDDAGYGTGNITRGNVTAVQQYAASAGSCVLPNCLSTTLTYDTTGQVRQVTDPKSNVTTLSYTDNFFHDNGSNPPQAYAPAAPTNAYLTSVDPPLLAAASLGYYFNTGKLAKSVDQNNADSYLHYLDSLDRLTHAYGPSVTGGRPWSLNQYPSATQLDTYATVSDATASSSCTSCVHQQATTDNLGRVTQSKLVNDPEGATMVDTAYDSSGRVQNVKNPYRSTLDPTYGVETPSYDGVNRTTQTTHADSSFAQVFYGAAVTGGGGASSQLCSSSTYGLGYPVLFKDEASKKRQVWTDGLGRTIEVDEPDSGGTLNLNTCYKYDLLDSLKEVNQGTQNRTYTYDALSRLTASTTPEGGALNLYYTTTGGALCAGDASAVCRRTDARGITTTYVYDALDRRTSVTYSDSTPGVSFFYDQTSYNGLTITNGKGRRTGMSDASGTTAWSYDAAGRVLAERRTINASPNVTKNISYSYNLGGGVTTITYPHGRVITYTHSVIGRPLTAKDVANNVNYVTNALYAPQGALSSLKNGVTGTFAGITRTNGYNNRLQGTLLSAASPSQTVFSLSYGYGTSNNSQIASIANNLNNNRTQSFTYDTLRRLSTAQSQATSGADCWGQSFPAYDRWGNKPTDTVTKCTAPALSVAIASASNRITSTGFAYDTAGDLTNENGPTYTWNAEEQITAAAGVTYSYDGDGLRVKKSNGKMYWRGMGIDVLAESDLSGNSTMEYVYFAGKRMAAREASGTVYYLFEDHRGSTVAATNATGVPCFDADYFPYGADNLKLNTCLQVYRHAGYERDPETGLDYAIFRYYNSRLGRFMSPDPVDGDVANPQSLNRYTYVRNDPVNLTDALGLVPFRREIEDRIDLNCAGVPLPYWVAFPIEGGGGGGGSPAPEVPHPPVFDISLVLRLNALGFGARVYREATSVCGCTRAIPGIVDGVCRYKCFCISAGLTSGVDEDFNAIPHELQKACAQRGFDTKGGCPLWVAIRRTKIIIYWIIEAAHFDDVLGCGNATQ